MREDTLFYKSSSEVVHITRAKSTRSWAMMTEGDAGKVEVAVGGGIGGRRFGELPKRMGHHNGESFFPIFENTRGHDGTIDFDSHNRQILPT